MGREARRAAGRSRSVVNSVMGNSRPGIFEVTILSAFRPRDRPYDDGGALAAGLLLDLVYIAYNSTPWAVSPSVLTPCGVPPRFMVLQLRFDASESTLFRSAPCTSGFLRTSMLNLNR